MVERLNINREIRVRVGGKLRLETTIPKSLTATQATTRRARVEELAALLRPLGKPLVGKGLLGKFARAPAGEEADKLERAVRRFIREPAKVEPAAPVSSTTFKDFGLHWASNGLAAEYPRQVRALSPSTVRSNTSLIVNLCKLPFGKLQVAAITKADCDKALDALPKSADSNSTVRHYGQAIQTVLRRAVHPAGLIAADKYPLPIKWLPPSGNPPSFPILYPTDVVMLLSCLSIPAWRRVLYGFAIYEGMRLGHILRLRYLNIDWANGRITIGIGKNNTNARTWKLNAGTQAALEWFRGASDETDFIFPRLTRSEVLVLSRTLRDDLVVAGVTREIRPDLFKSGDGQAPIRFQDLRATFVSLHLAMGWDEVEIMMRTQHTSTTVLHHHYGRRLGLAKAIIEDQGPLPPMDQALGLQVKPSRRAQRSVDALLGRVGKAQPAPKGGGKGGGKKKVRS